MRIATGEITDDIPSPESEGKDPAGVALGRKGGKARAKGMTAKRRKEIHLMNLGRLAGGRGFTARWRRLRLWSLPMGKWTAGAARPR